MEEPVTVKMPDPTDIYRLHAALAACKRKDSSEGEPGLDLLLDGLPGQNGPFTVSLKKIVYIGDSIGDRFLAKAYVGERPYACRILWQGDDYQPEVSLFTP